MLSNIHSLYFTIMSIPGSVAWKVAYNNSFSIDFILLLLESISSYMPNISLFFLANSDILVSFKFIIKLAYYFFNLSYTDLFLSYYFKLYEFYLSNNKFLKS